MCRGHGRGSTHQEGAHLDHIQPISTFASVLLLLRPCTGEIHNVISVLITNYIALAALKALGDFLQHIFMMGLQPKTSAVCIFSGLTTIYFS